jgi:hypothetical protein
MRLGAGLAGATLVNLHTAETGRPRTQADMWSRARPLPVRRYDLSTTKLSGYRVAQRRYFSVVGRRGTRGRAKIWSFVFFCRNGSRGTSANFWPSTYFRREHYCDRSSGGSVEGFCAKILDERGLVCSYMSNRGLILKSAAGTGDEVICFFVRNGSYSWSLIDMSDRISVSRYRAGCVRRHGLYENTDGCWRAWRTGRNTNCKYCGLRELMHAHSLRTS